MCGNAAKTDFKFAQGLFTKGQGLFIKVAKDWLFKVDKGCFSKDVNDW